MFIELLAIPIRIPIPDDIPYEEQSLYLEVIPITSFFFPVNPIVDGERISCYDASSMLTLSFSFEN